MSFPQTSGLLWHRFKEQLRPSTDATPHHEEAPLRAELLSLQQLDRHARELAGLRQAAVGRGDDRLLPRLAENERVLRDAYATVSAALAKGRRIAPAAEWLLDNFYLIEQQIHQARLHLPRTYSRRLPRLTAGPMAGFPRVYEIAVELISHLDGRLDDETTMRFVAAYQSVSPLSLGELWAFPIALRLGLIENLRRVAARIAYRRRERDAGIIWAERMLETATEQPRMLIHRLGEFADAHPGLTAPFLEEFCGRLRGQGTTVTFVLNWVEHALLDENTTEARLLQADSRAQAAEQIAIANSIGSLRFLGATDWKEAVESLSEVEAILRHDPSGAYAQQDFETRDRYRHVIERLAGSSRKSEAEVARQALAMAVAAAREGPPGRQSHIGYTLIGNGQRALCRLLGCRPSPRRWTRGLCAYVALPLYLGAILAITAAIVAAFLPLLASPGISGLLFGLLALTTALSASSLAVSLVNLTATLLLPPRELPRLDFSEGIPSDHRTMVAVPCLLQNEAELATLLEALEIRRIGNRDPNLMFALLTDFPDADTATLPGDESLLRLARAGLAALNQRHPQEGPGSVFYLFHRPRRWNPHEKLWMGYERKRGKLEQFNTLLRTDTQDAFSVMDGDLSILRSIKYVITLDADTDLPRGVAHRLIGAMAHPLNRPRVDPALGRVVEGYGILQPRASTRLASSGRSRFAQLFTGEPGIDPYTREVSDVYQDLFDQGSYVGKGIYDVDAFRETLDGRFPDNLILSHDLLESGYARSALFSSVEVYEDFPSAYLGEASRQHRWSRGDWQAARWIFPRPPTGRRPRGPNPLSLLTRWKLFDNIRRGLFAPALLTLLLAGWFLTPVAPWIFTLYTAAILFLSGILRALTQLLRKPPDRGWYGHVSAAGRAAAISLAEAVLAFTVLPYEAFLAADAFRLSGLRMLFSRRGLMLWTLPFYRRLNARSTLAGVAREMWPAAAIALGAASLLLLPPLRPTPARLAAALPFVAAWLLAPLVAWWVSRPIRPQIPTLEAAQASMLRALARKTWRYFETFVNDQENWLPPDNFQERPAPVIAGRTSPTNMGLTLLANLAAWDFGYLSTGRLLHRTRHTLDTMKRLERYQGHFFNWYDTRSLTPLPPRYVSSVDSGNLAGCLVALRGGLEELLQQPIIPLAITEGLRDTLSLLATAAGPQASPELRNALRAATALQLPTTVSPDGITGWLQHQRQLATDLVTAATPLGGEALLWAQAWADQLADHADDIASLLPTTALPPDSTLPTLERLADAQGGWPPAARAAAATRLCEINALVERCREFESAMDFRFLYDRSRHLLSIGFDVDSRRRDPGAYDLLASESRLASFLLIASEQAPAEHWFALGRLLTGREGKATLISWSGSMFEYLMPALLMPHYRNTLLDRTCRSVIARQIRYGRQRNIPWGISESCYHARDAHHTYQYRAFGIPGLGLQRGLAADLVVAPYATMLALPFAPREACENLQRLATQEDAMGAYGFYEAIDYTPARIPRGQSRAVIRAFMTHHQGMGLLAITNLLLHHTMVRRFMRDPGARVTELLLQERMPQTAPVLQPHEREMQAATTPPVIDPASLMRIFPSPDTPAPETHLLSNGNYHVMVTNTGGGYSRWRDLALTRWREDVTCDAWGSFVYLRDIQSPDIWSATYQPTCRHGERYEAIFTQGRAEFRRRDQEIETHVEICVSPEDDLEIRRITLSNMGRRPRRLEMTSFTEVVLAPANADLAHPAFSKLFVETEILPAHQAILCKRRPRAPEESTPYLFHLLVVPGAVETPSFETDRSAFLGRGRTTANPAAMEATLNRPSRLGNHAGTVLDPIAAIRHPVTLGTETAVVAHLITGVAPSREAALALIEKYRDHHFVDRAFEMAWSHSQIILRLLNVTEAETQMYGRLAGSMLYAHSRHRAAPSIMAQNRLGPQGLWRFGISGDLPILLLRIGNLQRLDRVNDALRLHAYWRMKGLLSDLIIVNEDFSGYRATLNEQIMAAIHAGPESALFDKPGGIFLRRTENLTEDDRILLQTVARVVLTDSADTLHEQVDRRTAPRRLPPPLKPLRADTPDPTPTSPPPRERIFDNGTGGFTPDGREYLIRLEPGQTTPAPWVNVIASPQIGTVVSESGGMYTWAGNAHEFRITPWYNDPVSDPSGEAFYLRDEETGRFWSLMPLPAPDNAGYLCRHGFGYSVFEHAANGLFTETWTYVAMDAPVKFVVVKLENRSGRRRRLSLTAFFELAMGEWRHGNAMHIVSELDPQTGAIFARNPYSREFADRLVFAGCSERDRSVTGSRTEFLGRNGSFNAPAALRRSRLSNVTGAGFDPGAGLQAIVELSEAQTIEVVFTLGAAQGTDAAQALLSRFGGRSGAQQALRNVWEHWNHLLGAVYVETPDPATNILMNGWLLYQALSCRLWGRSGYYQSGGAFGFRDQLQDAMALVLAAPHLLRQQILLCATHQFKEGDVQHWWHPPGGAGVRTHCSDDYLWLPQAVSRYVLATGDTGVLDEVMPFLEGRPVDPDEEAYYENHAHASESGTLYEHCVRALRHGLRFGSHDLPLIGSGDWNDGMNLVGAKGRGESVWLAWFLLDALTRFADVANLRDDQTMVTFCMDAARRIKEKTEASGWDGAWYRRAYFDDGTPLGSASNDECQIDSLSQSWAVISGGGDPLRAQQAMQSLEEKLVRREDGLILLFTPPFNLTAMEPGYIKGYPPGMRENGGQYTHGAVWSAIATALQGNHDHAWELFRMLNPILHGDSRDKIRRYQVEPYVMAADVYGAAPYVGRGGWTWYTGAAGWMYRLGTEVLLGIERHHDHLRITPRLPTQGWEVYRIHYRHGETVYHIEVRKAEPPDPLGMRIRVDNTLQPDDRIPLVNDQHDHFVEVYR